MRPIQYALAAVAVFLSAASEAQTETAPPRTAQLSKVIFKPDVANAEQRVKVGTICLFAGSPLNFGSGERTLNYERFERLFTTVLKKRGFNVVAKSADLFEGEGNTPKADYLVGATLHVQTVDICDSVNGVKGTIGVAVEWQIYDRSKQQVVETATTKGTGQLPKFQTDGLTALVDEAFSSAAIALVNQGTFQKYLGSPVPKSE